jgi:hypothetical protein
MLAYEDPRWKQLKGGYKVHYDPTLALRKLESGIDVDDAWEELWEELHHQGDIDEASYAAVPNLVYIHQTTRSLDWNLYALVSIIEVERHRKINPPLPAWLADSYHDAWKTLLKLALEDLRETDDDTTVQSLMGAVALGKGRLKLGAIISKFTEDELLEILEQQDDWAELYSD